MSFLLKIFRTKIVFLAFFWISFFVSADVLAQVNSGSINSINQIPSAAEEATALQQKANSLLEQYRSIVGKENILAKKYEKDLSSAQESLGLEEYDLAIEKYKKIIENLNAELKSKTKIEEKKGVRILAQNLIFRYGGSSNANTIILDQYEAYFSAAEYFFFTEKNYATAEKYYSVIVYGDDALSLAVSANGKWKIDTDSSTRKVASLKKAISLAEKTLPLYSKNYDSILTNNLVIDSGKGFDVTKEDEGTETALQRGFFQNLLPKVNRIIGAVGLLYLVIVGIQYIFSRGNEEESKKAKMSLLYVSIGLGVVSLAEFGGFDLFNPAKDIIEGGEVLSSFGNKTKQIIRVLEVLFGAFFLVQGGLSAYQIMASNGSDAVDKEKKFLYNFLMGAMFFVFAEVIIRIVSGSVGNPNETASVVVQETAGIVNFALTFLGSAALLMVVLASLYYVSSFGNEEQTGRAKKIIIYSVLTGVICFSSFTVIRFLVVQ